MLLTRRRRCSTIHICTVFIIASLATYIIWVSYTELRMWAKGQPDKTDINPDKSRRKQAERFDDWNCSKQLTLLTPSMGPFNAWREYVHLKALFPPVNMVNHISGDRKQIPQFDLKCPKYRCNLKIGATLADKGFLRATDGVIINMAPNLLKKKLPSKIHELNTILTKDTVWLFWGMESPDMFIFWDAMISNITYHYDITYHSQSAFSIPYGYFIDHDPVDKISSRRNWANAKTNLISWMASNCDNTFWPRTEFVYELQKFIPVDIYGKCGNLTCLPPMSPACNSKLEKYKFYLALENAECDEYMTEKFWESCLQHGIVPVVYGGRRSAYEKLAPPNSFIHVGDFTNTKELADYLLMLDKNDDKYNKYLEWRRMGHVKTNYPPLDPAIFCESIPLLDLKLNSITKNTIYESSYFNSCRGKPSGKFAKAGGLSSWSPWN